MGPVACGRLLSVISSDSPGRGYRQQGYGVMSSAGISRTGQGTSREPRPPNRAACGEQPGDQTRPPAEVIPSRAPRKMRHGSVQNTS